MQKEFGIFKEQVTMEKTKAMIEFTNFRKQCEDKEALMKRESTAKLESYKIEIQVFAKKVGDLSI